MFACRRNKPTIISLLDRTKNYPITSSGERHNILHTARLHNIVINSNLAVSRNGTSRAPSPTILPRLHHAAKSLCSLRIYVVIGDRIGGADFCSVITFDKKHNFCVLFLIISAPCRLSPNEALPHTPQGALPLDPTSPLAPGLSVRFISRFARCLGAALLIPHSSLLIPNSSFLTPHLNSPLIFPVICSIINEIVHNNRKILTERIFIKWK